MSKACIFFFPAKRDLTIVSTLFKGIRMLGPPPQQGQMATLAPLIAMTAAIIPTRMAGRPAKTATMQPNELMTSQSVIRGRMESQARRASGGSGTRTCGREGEQGCLSKGV